MAEAEENLPCFSQGLQDAPPVSDVGEFAEFVHSALSDVSHEIHQSAVRLFSENCSEVGRQLGDDSSFGQIGTAEEDTCAKSWLSWATNAEEPLHPYIRSTVHQIPEGILPPTFCNVSLTDFRIVCARRIPGQARRKGPSTDDAVYAEFKELRDKLARGNCFLEYSCGKSSATTSTASDTERHQACVVFGLRKFTGGLGDEDDDLVDHPDEDESAQAAAAAVTGRAKAPRWANFFSARLTDVKSVVATAKANGEAAHFAVRYVQNCWLIFAGSKNMHLVFGKRSDLQHYSSGSFAIAKVVAEAVCDMLDAMETKQRLMCLSFLACTGVTAIFELLQPTYQHVECLSHLKRPQLAFICWSSFMDSMKDVCVGALDPILCHHLAKAFGLHPVDAKELPLCELDAYLTKVRTDYGREGDVLYFLDEKRRPVGLLKRKTVWYVCIRAIREKTKSAVSQRERRAKDKKAKGNQHAATAHPAPSDSHHMRGVWEKIRKRFAQIAVWLEFGEECQHRWETLGIQFVNYAVENIDSGTFAKEELHNRFPDVWKRFLLDSDSTDDIPTDIPPSTAASLVFGAASGMALSE